MAQAEVVGDKLPDRWVNAWRQRLVVTTLLASDLLTALLTYVAALALYHLWRPEALSGLAVSAILGSVAVWLGLRAATGLYPGYGLNSVEELRRQTHAVALTLAIIAVLALTAGAVSALSLLPVVLAFAGLSLLAPLVRHFVMQAIRQAGLWGKPVLVMVSTEDELDLVSTLKEEWKLGFRPVTVVDERIAAGERLTDYASYEPSLARAEELAGEHGVDTAILAMSRIRRELLAQVAGRLNTKFRNVTVVPDIGGVANAAAVGRDLAGTFGVEIRQNLLDPWAKRAKRTLDLFGVLVGGLLISPLLLAIVVLVKLDSRGPAFYGQRRVGTGGAHFRCWKFRTMHADAERLLDQYLQSNPDLRAEWESNQKLRDDPRVTRVGHLLRKTSLDELPQLWNVLRGEMSLAGPRPIVDAEIAKYSAMYSLYCQVTPGISGLWQVSGRSNTSYDYRVALDAYYVRNWSVWLDLLILARTVGSVLFGRGAV